LSKNCQKDVTKFSKSWQKVVKKCQKAVKKVSKSWRKIVKNLVKILKRVGEEEEEKGGAHGHL
jgi:phage-related protein